MMDCEEYSIDLLSEFHLPCPNDGKLGREGNEDKSNVDDDDLLNKGKNGMDSSSKLVTVEGAAYSALPGTGMAAETEGEAEVARSRTGRIHIFPLDL
ncbi:hypothetical protein ACHAXS_009241 [Conticribra weissflogii]